MTKHTKSYLIAWTRNVSYLNLKYQKSVTISCDWSIVALVTDRAWCERRIRIDNRWDFTKSLYICKFQVKMVICKKCSSLLKSLCYMRPDKMSLLEKNIKAHFINVRTVKTVIRERINKKWQKRRKMFLSKGNNPGCKWYYLAYKLCRDSLKFQ